MKAARLLSLLLISAFLMTSVIGGTRRTTDRERAGQPDDLAPVGAAVRFRPQACPESHEVLLGGFGCGSEDSIYFYFYATGGAVDGLQREFTPGTSNFIYVSVQDCDSVAQEIMDLVQERGCALAPSFGTSASMVCDGGRNSMIDIVAQMLRTAYADAPDL